MIQLNTVDHLGVSNDHPNLACSIDRRAHDEVMEYHVTTVVISITRAAIHWVNEIITILRLQLRSNTEICLPRLTNLSLTQKKL